MENKVSELEHLYLPSRWSRNYKDPNECLEKHIEVLTKKSAIVRKNIAGNYDVSYGSNNQKYDLIGTDLPDSAPLIFYIHGGYWQEKIINRINNSAVTEQFYRNGIKTFMVGYDLCPEVTLPDIIDQIQQAFRICYDYAKEKCSRNICICGHSAGAHLSVYASNSPCIKKDENILKAVFLIAGVYDLSPLVETSINDPLRLSTSDAFKWSPIKTVAQNKDVKFFVMVGKYDSPAFIEQSKLYYEKIIKENVNSEFLIIDKVDHFEIIEKLLEDDFELTKLITNFILT